MPGNGSADYVEVPDSDLIGLSAGFRGYQGTITEVRDHGTETSVWVEFADPTLLDSWFPVESDSLEIEGEDR